MGVAIVFAVIVVVLLLLMVTGYNEQIPYLHLSSGGEDTIVGDRDTLTFLFLANGTFLNSTQSNLCTECPFTIATSARFTYNLTVNNGFSAGGEVTHISAPSPFQLTAISPTLPFPIAAGLSEMFELSLTAPSTSGTYAMVFNVDASIA